MDINTLFLAGLALIEFGIIIYLLFKVDNFQKKVKDFFKENLIKDEKFLELKSIIKEGQIELQELRVTLKETINFRDELIREKEALEKKLKYLEDEMLKTSTLAKQEVPKAVEKPVDKVVEKLKRKKKIIF